MDSDLMRYAEYTPKSSVRSETDIDKRFGGTLIAVGLGVAAAAFAGRYALHLWKPLGQVISETAKKIPTSAFSSYYKGGFEQKMTKREASLILGVSPTSSKAKVREAHKRIMVLNHPDKGQRLGVV
ncbi:dnaJ-like subfamily C member 15-like [Scleropages formosus]|uniref:DnaJ-like subfamily C member 15-like n=1 Tax=Scleropages formosus TaxID=113540 RepID=A0A0P7VWG4_SCLFO|nr:dnaJ-like subfamily C member 15-like [Scleropages formosus]